MSHSDKCARCGYSRRSHIDTVAGLLCPNAKFQPPPPDTKATTQGEDGARASGEGGK